MHNGCLLLLAFVAVFQPIASYSERGLVNGRQDRCDYRTSVRDPGLHFYGTYRFTKPAVKDRRRQNGEDIREVRRNEVREESLRIASSAVRRLADTAERDRNTRLIRDRSGNDAVLRREIREARLTPIYRDERDQESRRVRLSSLRENHQARYSNNEGRSSLSEDDFRSQRINSRRLSDRVLVAPRRDDRGNEAWAKHVRENREVRVAGQRAKNDEVNEARSLNGLHITREGVQRMDERRSVSSTQLDRNADREILGRRFRDRELRSASVSSNRENRAYNNEDTTSLDRNYHRKSSGRVVDEPRQSPDISRMHLLTELRNIRDSESRMNKNYRIAENLLTDNQREHRDTENKARLVRAIRCVENDRTVTGMFERQRSPENRRNVKDAQSMERIRSLDRNTESRKDSRYTDHTRVVENRRNGRNNIRAADTRRDIRNSNRNTCIDSRARTVDRYMSRLVSRQQSQGTQRYARNVEFRTITAERGDENLREARHAGVRDFRTERSVENRREARTNGIRDFRTERNIAVRAVRIGRTDESQRDARIAGVRDIRTERTDKSQRDAGNVEVRAVRTDRADESRREARTVGVRDYRTERNIEVRATRTDRTDETPKDARITGIRVFRTERSDESRREARKIEARAVRARTNEIQRDSRTAGIRDIRAEPADVSRRETRTIKSESRRDARIAGVPDLRTEHTDESRRETRNFEVRAIRAELGDESRRESRIGASRGIRTEPVVVSRREARTVRSESRRDARIAGVRNIRTERTNESRRGARNVEVREARTERTDESRRDAHIAGVRNIRTERTDESRREARNFEVRAIRADRNDESHRESRSAAARDIRTKPGDVSQRVTRTVGVRVIGTEIRQDARIAGVRDIRTERTDNSRQEARSNEVQALRADHSAENRREPRIAGARDIRTDRSDESRRKDRNVEVRAFRTESATGNRHDAPERQTRSLNRVIDSRRNQETTLESRRNVRNTESRIENERASNVIAARRLEREARSIGRESRLYKRNERDSKTVMLELRSKYNRERAADNRRVESSAMNLVRNRDDLNMQRKNNQMTDKRYSLDNKRAYPLQQEARRDTRSSERENLATGFREAESRKAFGANTAGLARTREVLNIIRNPEHEKNETPIMNWQNVFYTMQAIYICGLLMQFSKGSVEKKNRRPWWSAPQHLIKVD